jgi:hypothetical protein
MNFNKPHRSYLVGAQFIGAPPIHRPEKGIDGPLADKSAMGAIKSAPTDILVILLKALSRCDANDAIECLATIMRIRSHHEDSCLQAYQHMLR